MPDRRASAPWIIRYASVINMTLLAVIALMGFWLRYEFLDFARREIQPLAQRIERENFDRQLANQKLEATVQRLETVTDELRDELRRKN